MFSLEFNSPLVIKKLNLSQGDYDRAVVDITSESDRDLIKQLLKMSGINIGKGDK